MKEEYVNEEITRKLIDKGCPVRLVIKADEPIPILYELPKEHPDWQDCKAWYIPTISQVLKWLREEHAIHIGISLRKGWYFEIIQYKYYEEEKKYDYKLMTVSVTVDSYEEAVIEGIKYVIDNLI